VKDAYAITNVAVRNVGAPFVNNCGTFHVDGPPEFDVRLLGGNDVGWADPTWCENRPPVVPPLPPSAWN
jgi:hypothetical protein